MPVTEITAGTLLKMRAILINLGLQPRTINHYMACALQVLRSAVDFDDLVKVPRLKKLKAEGRERWLRHDEARRLLAALPDYMRQMARFALETGMRRGNVCGLKWAHVHWDEKLI